MAPYLLLPQQLLQSDQARRRTVVRRSLPQLRGWAEPESQTREAIRRALLDQLLIRVNHHAGGMQANQLSKKRRNQMFDELAGPPLGRMRHAAAVVAACELE